MVGAKRLLSILLILEVWLAVPTAAMPSFMGLYVERFGYDLGLAGRIASVETLGLATGQLFALICLARAGVNLRRAALAALLIFAASQLLSSWSQSVVPFGIARFLSAAGGGGLMFSIVGLYVATLPDRDRAYSLYYGIPFVVGPLGLFVLPRLFAQVDFQLIYIALALGAASLIPLARLLPVRRTPPTEAAITPADDSRRSRAVPALLATSLFINYVGNGGVWVYMERIGEAFAIASETRGFYLAAGMATGLLGTALGIAAAGRIKRLHAVLIGNGALIVGYMALTVSATPGNFIAGAVIQSIAVTFVTPFYLSALAGTDEVGRNVTIGLLAFGLGYGLGPGILSIFVTADFHALLFVASATALLAATLAFAAAAVERRISSPNLTALALS